MLLQPFLLLRSHQIELCLISNYLALLFQEASDIVSKEVIRDNESFLTLEAFLARVRNTIGIIVVLRWSANKDTLML